MFLSLEGRRDEGRMDRKIATLLLLPYSFIQCVDISLL